MPFVDQKAQEGVRGLLPDKGTRGAQARGKRLPRAYQPFRDGRKDQVLITIEHTALERLRLIALERGLRLDLLCGHLIETIIDDGLIAAVLED